MPNQNKTAASGRAVITGLGAVTPVGRSVPEMWDNLLKGKSGIGLISQFDTGMIACKVGAEVPDWKAEEQVGRRTASETDRFIQFAMVAAAEALRESGLNLDSEDRERLGVVMGNTIGGMPNITRQQEKITTEGRVRLSPYFVTSMMPNMAAAHLSVLHGLLRSEHDPEHRLRFRGGLHRHGHDADQGRKGRRDAGGRDGVDLLHPDPGRAGSRPGAFRQQRSRLGLPPL